MIQISNPTDLWNLGLGAAINCDDPGAWCMMDEAMIIYSVLRAQNVKEFYESGTCNGWSASWAALAMGEEGHVYTFDITPKTLIYTNTNLEERITQTIAPFSEGVKPVVSQHDPNNRMAVFIDGDHSTKVCQDDLDAVEKHLRVNDIVFFHDTKRARYDGILKIYESMTRKGMYEGINFAGTRNGIAVVRKCHKS